MACTYTYLNKKYSEDQFRNLLKDGELDKLAKENNLPTKTLSAYSAPKEKLHGGKEIINTDYKSLNEFGNKVFGSDVTSQHKDIFDLADKLGVKVDTKTRPNSGRSYASYEPATNTIHIDSPYSEKGDMLNDVLHEIVHAELNKFDKTKSYLEYGKPLQDYINSLSERLKDRKDIPDDLKNFIEHINEKNQDGYYKNWDELITYAATDADVRKYLNDIGELNPLKEQIKKYVGYDIISKYEKSESKPSPIVEKKGESEQKKEVVDEEKVKLTEEQQKSKDFAEGDLPSKLFAKKDKLSSDYLPKGELDVKPIEQKIASTKENTTESKTKALKNIVGDDSMRPIMTGVFHDAENKKLIATDAHVLVVIPDESLKTTKVVSPKDLKPLTKEFLKNNTKFPSYQDVIPEGNPISLKINLQDWLNKTNGVSRAQDFFEYYGSGSPIPIRIRVGDSEYFFNAKNINRVLKVFADRGVKDVTVELSKPTRAMVIKGDGILGLVMPIMEDAERPHKTILDREMTPEEQKLGVQQDIEGIKKSIERNKKQLEEEIADKSEFGIEYQQKRIKEDEEELAQKQSDLDRLNNPLQEQQDLQTVKRNIKNGNITSDEATKFTEQENESLKRTEPVVENIERKAESEKETELVEAIKESDRIIKTPESANRHPIIDKIIEAYKSDDYNRSLTDFADDFVMSRLSGNGNKGLRQEIMSTLTGKKVTKAESGITNLKDAIRDYIESESNPKVQNEITQPIETQTDNGQGEKPSAGEAKKEEKTFTEKGKKLADKIRSLKFKPLDLKDENGNPLTIEKKGIDLDPILDAIADAVEKGGELADVIKEELEKAKWYQALTDKGKDSVKQQLEDQFNERVTGITHAQTDEAARSLGLPEYEKSPETKAEWDEKAQERISNGEMPDLIRKLEKGDMPDKVEQRMMAMYAADLLAKIEKNPTNELINKYGDFKKLADIVGGREVAKSLVARQGQQPVMENVADMYIDKMGDLGVEKLTDAQKTELQKKHDEYLKLKSEAEAKIKEADEKMAKLNAEKEIAKEKVKTAAKPREKKTHADYVAERKTYIETAREKLKKLRGEQQVTIVPYARELVAISPEVGKMVKSLVNEGIDKLDDIVKAIHNEFKGDIKGLTEKDVHDIIAGEYTKKHPTKAALELQVKDLRDEAKLINQLEALQKGDTPKSEKIAIERNQRIKELQDQIKDFKKEKADAEKKAEEARKTAEKEVIKENYSPERKALEAVKKKNFDQIQKIKKDLAEGNFEKAPKTPFLDNRELRVKYPELWKQTMDAIAAREDAQHEYEVGRIRDQMSKRSTGEKIIDVGKGIAATVKALRQGIDDSAVFVQNIRALIAHPKSALKALPGHLKDFASEKSYTRWLTDLHNHHFAWDLIHKSGLDITDPKSLRQQGREEPFSYNLLDKTFEVKGKKYNIGKNTVRPFERMFTSLGNRLRADAFLRMSEKFYNQGKTFETHPEEFKSLARVLNNETGRGKIANGLEGIAKVIPIWSPRLLTSYINTLGLSDIAFAADWLKGAGKPKRGYYASMTPRMRTYAAASFAKHIGVVLSVMGLASLYGWKPDLNPRSSTFGTIEKDGKTYNMFGGYNSLVKLIAQFTTGKVTRDGVTQKLDAAKWAGLPIHFIRGKLTPLAGTATDILWGTIKNRELSAENYLGQRVPISQELLQNVTPLSVDGIANGVKNEGIQSLFTTGLPSFFGVNVNYEADFKQSVPNEIKVGTMTKELTEKQHQEYQDYYDTYKEKYINTLESLPDYISADDDKKQLMRSMTNSMIKTDAENKMRELYPNIFKETEAERTERLKREKEKEAIKNKIRGKSTTPKSEEEGKSGDEGRSEDEQKSADEK